MRCTKAPPHRLTPLLLVFVLLCLTAPSWAMHIHFSQPRYNHDTSSKGSMTFDWTVEKDNPSEFCLGLSKVQYYVDGVMLQEKLWPSPTLAMLDSWTYDARRSPSGQERHFTIRVWVWQSVFGGMPPMPQLIQQEIEGGEAYETFVNPDPLSDLDWDDDGISSTLTVAGTVAYNDLQVTVAGSPVQVSSGGEFETTVQLAQGSNELEVVVTDPLGGDGSEQTVVVHRANLTTQLATNSADVGVGQSISISTTPAGPALVKGFVHDAKGLQTVRELGSVEAQANQLCSFSWDGTPDSNFDKVCSNGKVTAGTYVIRVISYAPEDIVGFCKPLVSHRYEVTITNTGGVPPVWTKVELEQDVTGLSRIGTWYAADHPFYSNAFSIGQSGESNGATLTYTFTGSGVDVVYSKEPGGTQVRVKLDGVQHGVITTESGDEASYYNQSYAVTNLSQSQHILTLEPLPDENGITYCWLDSLRVYNQGGS